MSYSALESHENDVYFHVWVVPGASSTELVGRYNEMIRFRVAAPAEAGRANREAARFLTEKTGGKVTLLRGMSSRHKVFQVSGIDVRVVSEKLGLDIWRW